MMPGNSCAEPVPGGGLLLLLLLLQLLFINPINQSMSMRWASGT
jgi:hypothetical protein